MSQIKVIVNDAVIDEIATTYSALSEFHQTLTSYANGQKYDEDSIIFYDDNRDFSAQGKIDKMLKLASVVSLAQGFGGLIKIHDITVFATMSKAFFDDETNTVPSGFMYDTWTETDEEGNETVHNTSWKKWVELTNRTPRLNVAEDEVMFGLHDSTSLLNDTDIALLNTTYTIFDLATKELEPAANIKLYTTKGIQELMQTPAWANE